MSIFFLEPGPIPLPLQGYNKTTSIFEVLQLGLPTQEGIIITDWNDNVANITQSFLNIKQWNQVLIRTDKKGETGKYMRGGYIISIKEVPAECQRILSLGRIVLLLEPASKYENLYAINVLIQMKQNIVLLEIVGPGFDASDLNRGDISPHERVCLKIKNEQVTPYILRKDIINQAQYQDSVKARLRKIGVEAITRGWSDRRNDSQSELEELGRNYLLSLNSTLLLDSADSYQPFSEHLLKKLVDHISDLPWQLPSLIEEDEYAISTTVRRNIDKYCFIFWDIVCPSRKYKVNRF